MNKLFSCLVAISMVLLATQVIACGGTSTKAVESKPVVQKEAFPWDSLDPESRAFYSKGCLQATEEHALLMELPVLDTSVDEENNALLQYREISDSRYVVISYQQLVGPKKGLTAFTIIFDSSVDPAAQIGMYIEYNVYKELIENPDGEGDLIELVEGEFYCVL